MPGFKHDPLADVNLIADNLRDRYKDRFSILKELLQNADDARAEEIRFGLLPGTSSSTHPLLRGPGLVIVNNGTFKESDYSAILHFGLNEKAAEAATIGKFGLGMKSVFHFAEAFLFMAEGNGSVYRELVNPWGDSFHPDWGILDSQWDQLREDALSAVGWTSTSSPFILYLPLRQEVQLRLPDGQVTGAIVEECVGDTGVVASLLADVATGNRLASVLPLLRSLRVIQVYVPEVDGESLRNRYAIELASGATRPLRDHQSGESALSCEIKIVHNNTEARRLRYVGRQRYEMTEALAQIRDSRAWPSSWVRDAYGRPDQVPDKSQPHAAAVFGQDGEPGWLTIRWAVFLPIEEHEERILLETGTPGFSLALHGHFFVDAGRNGLYGLDADTSDNLNDARDESWVRRQWNWELAGRATLDLMIPALDDFAKEVELSEERASALAGALTGSKLWSKWKQSIAANYKWVRTVDRLGPRWAKIGTESTLPIPVTVEADPGRPWRVFPTLESVCAHAVLYDPDARNLVASDKDLGAWGEDEVVSLLNGVNEASVFSSSVDAAYLAGFMTGIGFSVLTTRAVQEALCDLLRRSARVVGLQVLRNVAVPVQKVAALIDRDRKLRIEIRNVAIAELLAQQPTVALVWPKELDSGDVGIPNLDDVELLLISLSNERENAEGCRQYAEQLLGQLSDEQRRALILRLDQLPILTAYDCQLGQKRSVSASELSQAWARRTLFRPSQGRSDSERAGLGLAFQRVLPNEPILIINTDLAKLILGKEAEVVPTCEAKGLFRCLAHQARMLGPQEERRKLLGLIRLPDGDPEAIKGLRFLLHAREQHLDSSTPLWMERGEQSTPWRKLWQAVVGPDQMWTIVSADLATQLSETDCRAIGLRAIEPDEVRRLVLERGVVLLGALELKADEYNTILAWERWEPAVWKSLPFHETTAGKRVAITDFDTCLEQPGIELPWDLLADANVIVRSSDARLAAIQNRNIKPLDYAKAIQIAAGDAVPARWCEFVLESLACCSPSRELLRSLSDKPWLRLISGRAVTPANFIVLPELEDQVARIASQTDAFGSPSLLPLSLRDHPAVEMVREALFPTSNGIDALARMMRDRHELAVGELGVVEKRHVKDLAALLKDAPLEGFARGWQLVDAISGSYGEENGVKVMNALLYPVSLNQVIAVLRWLPDQEAHSGTARSFEVYLSLLVAAQHNHGLLRELRLRASDGSWRWAAELCDDVPGVAKGVMLCQEHSDILKQVLNAGQQTWAPSAITVTDDRGTPEVVRDYFAAWLQRGLGVQVGALMALICGDTELKADAENALLPHTLDWLLNEIPWKIIDPLPFGGSRQPLDGLTLEKAVRRSAIRVRAVNIEHLQVRSLLGETITVPAEKHPSQLLVGMPSLQLTPTRPSAVVLFRNVDLSLFSDSELSAILRRTAEQILRSVYFQGVNLRPIWDALDCTEQFDVKVAERLILDNLPFYLRQLKPQNAPALTALLRQVEGHRRLVAEFEGRKGLEEEKLQELNGALHKLREMLRHNKEVQAGVLEAVRDKLRDSQYQISSIPFELFQNADDAYIQLREIQHFAQLPSPDMPNKFAIVRQGESIAFLHWGRPINWVGSQGFDGRARGYDRDLEKMLILSSSEKQLSLENGQATPVTGKFGLGFKSVLLACDQPAISSGNLLAVIVGGILPIALARETAQQIRKFVGTHGASSRSPGTLVHLALNPLNQVTDVMSEFLRFAGYLCAFGLAIREITYTDESQTWKTVWSGKTVGDVDAVQHGTLPARSLIDPDTLSILRIELAAGVVLFGLGPGGIVALPTDVPALWVTGPTRESEYFGLAVCAMFDVDPGRARLSGNKHRNILLAETIGRELGATLRNLRALSWDVLRADAGIGAGTSEYDFWNSLWSLLHGAVTRPGGGASEIVRPLVEACYREIARDLKVVPNGLPGDLKALTNAESVHYKLTGALRVADCASPLFGWQNWKQHGYGLHEVVSVGVAEGLNAFGFPTLLSVSLATIASWLTGDTVRSDDARILGQVLKGLPKEADRTQEINKDLEDTRKLLASVRFYSQARTTERAIDLVVSAGKDDESRRATFAPNDRQLSKDYDDTAVTFFKFCRRQMEASAQSLAEWALASESTAARQAALNYLLTGDLRPEMQECIRDRGIGGTWLDSLSEDDAWVAGLTVQQLGELRCRILPRLDQLQANAAPSIIQNRRNRNPRATLERIEKWWGACQADQLRRYEGIVYPNATVPLLVAPHGSGFDRSEWLVLFGRATFYRMGRATDEQHRSYIEHAQRRGWWAVFAAANPQRNAKAWMGVLDEFYDAQVDDERWEHWTRWFSAIYKLSRWLEPYVELFLDLDRQNTTYDLDAVLKPRSDKGQQGGGIDPPPPGLGIGACFVLRELLRLKHIHSEYSHEHAFVPSKQVRELLIAIGLEIDNEPNVRVSSQIYVQLANHLDADRARFGGAYDIPFRVIAEDSRLQGQLLGDGVLGVA